MPVSRRSILALSLLITSLALAPRALAEDFRGNWTLSKSERQGMVLFGLMHRARGASMQHESDWPASAMQGLDIKPAGKRDVQFSITRDAGRFDCEGYLKDGEGAGLFRFTANPRFAPDMAALGFHDIDAEKQFLMAVHDVSIEFAKAIKAEELDDLDADKIIAFRIFDVNAPFIRAMRAAGLPAKEADKLIAFRVHGVSPEMVQDLRQQGIEADEDMLIAFRVHGVSAEFVARIERLGYERPQPDQLVAMRVHGVTPEFITSLKSRGLKDLSIDQLINLRVHGIE
jgi:hypothetical protein